MLILQLKFDGVTSKRMKGRLANPVHRDMKTEKILANQKSCIVKNLSPKTLYTFNISAFYKSGEFGPPQMVRVYTRLLGNVQSVSSRLSDSVDLLKFVTVQFLTYMCLTSSQHWCLV